MNSVTYYLFLIVIGFILIATPIVLVLGIVSGVKVDEFLYVFGFVELAGVAVYIAYKIFARKHKGPKLRNSVIVAAIIACAVSAASGIFLTKYTRFRRSNDSYHSSSYTSYSLSRNTNHSYGGSGNSGGSGGASSRSTARPAATTRPVYSGSSSRSTTRPQRTVNPEDHDIESYYLDYQDEFEDEDDAWDDFEDDPDVWDDY